MTAPPFHRPSHPAAAESTQRRERVVTAGAPLVEWLVESALPLWSTTGVDFERGGFFEKIGLDGRPIDEPRRARVVARQIYVFATAAKNDWLPGAERLVEHGMAFLFDRLRAADGTIAAAVWPDGRLHKGGFDLYEHAFVLFALAAVYRIDPRDSLRHEAENLLERMRRGWAHPHRGFEEAAPRALPLKSNPHMHLLEAAIAWHALTQGARQAGWSALVGEIVELCLDRFIGANGALLEYFDGDWRPMPGRQGRIIEPGHQFEWAWLLMRSAGASGAAGRLDAASRLLEIGEEHGVDTARGVAVNELDLDLRVTDPAAKLWPQTERLKAWHLAASTADLAQLAPAEAALRAAVTGLQRYFVASPAGLWREQMEASGRFEVPDCRASSLYHIVCAIDALQDGAGAAGP